MPHVTACYSRAGYLSLIAFDLITILHTIASAFGRLCLPWLLFHDTVGHKYLTIVYLRTFMHEPQRISILLPQAMLLGHCIDYQKAGAMLNYAADAVGRHYFSAEFRVSCLWLSYSYMYRLDANIPSPMIYYTIEHASKPRLIFPSSIYLPVSFTAYITYAVYCIIAILNYHKNFAYAKGQLISSENWRDYHDLILKSYFDGSTFDTRCFILSPIAVMFLRLY